MSSFRVCVLRIELTAVMIHRAFAYTYTYCSSNKITVLLFYNQSNLIKSSVTLVKSNAKALMTYPVHHKLLLRSPRVLKLHYVAVFCVNRDDCDNLFGSAFQVDTVDAVVTPAVQILFFCMRVCVCFHREYCTH